MGALVACVLVIGAGFAGGALVGSHFTRHLVAGDRGRIARATVMLLVGASGALIAAQLDVLVRTLEDISSVPVGLEKLADVYDTLAVSEALHGVLLDGGVLIGLATIVGVLATRQQGDLRAVSGRLSDVGQRP